MISIWNASSGQPNWEPSKQHLEVNARSTMSSPIRACPGNLEKALDVGFWLSVDFSKMGVVLTKSATSWWFPSNLAVGCVDDLHSLRLVPPRLPVGLKVGERSPAASPSSLRGLV